MSFQQGSDTCRCHRRIEQSCRITIMCCLLGFGAGEGSSPLGYEFRNPMSKALGPKVLKLGLVQQSVGYFGEYMI